MILRIFETHIQVKNLEQAMRFYEDILGLELGTIDQERRIAFYWVGGRNQSMLGLWEVKTEEIAPRHFAFQVSPDDLPKLTDHLRKHNINMQNFLNDGTDNPMVFAWMPAIAIYFRDLDQNSLEFIAPLSDPPQPELGIVSVNEWHHLNQ